ncbi:MAG: hypothetical protein RBR71_10025 [Gudongella sp.]|nr:hypothetical protein [Gudongella sp.]
MELWMEILLLFTPGLILVSILYMLNKVFKYKDKLISTFGTIKYKVALFVSGGIAYYILVFKYDLNSRSPVFTAVFLSYIYLVQYIKR